MREGQSVEFSDKEDMYAQAGQGIKKVLSQDLLTSYRSSLACSRSKSDSDGVSATADRGVTGCRVGDSGHCEEMDMCIEVLGEE
jgi:hypothetical protein